MNPQMEAFSVLSKSITKTLNRIEKEEATDLEKFRSILEAFQHFDTMLIEVLMDGIKGSIDTDDADYNVATYSLDNEMTDREVMLLRVLSIITSKNSILTEALCNVQPDFLCLFSDLVKTELTNVSVKVRRLEKELNQ